MDISRFTVKPLKYSSFSIVKIIYPDEMSLSFRNPPETMVLHVLNDILIIYLNISVQHLGIIGVRLYVRNNVLFDVCVRISKMFF